MDINKLSKQVYKDPSLAVEIIFEIQPNLKNYLKLNRLKDLLIKDEKIIKEIIKKKSLQEILALNPLFLAIKILNKVLEIDKDKLKQIEVDALLNWHLSSIKRYDKDLAAIMAYGYAIKLASELKKDPKTFLNKSYFTKSSFVESIHKLNECNKSICFSEEVLYFYLKSLTGEFLLSRHLLEEDSIKSELRNLDFTSSSKVFLKIRSRFSKKELDLIQIIKGFDFKTLLKRKKKLI